MSDHAQHFDPDCDVCVGVRRAAPPSDPAAPLREAALWLATATDNLAHWDHAHGYVVNSERDWLAGNVESAWDALRAALATNGEEKP